SPGGRREPVGRRAQYLRRRQRANGIRTTLQINHAGQPIRTGGVDRGRAAMSFNHGASRTPPRHAGFGLVDLLALLAVLSFLAAIAVPLVVRSRSSAHL